MKTFVNSRGETFTFLIMGKDLRDTLVTALNVCHNIWSRDKKNKGTSPYLEALDAVTIESGVVEEFDLIQGRSDWRRAAQDLNVALKNVMYCPECFGAGVVFETGKVCNCRVQAEELLSHIEASRQTTKRVIVTPERSAI